MSLQLNTYELLIEIACLSFISTAVYLQLTRGGRDLIANYFLSIFCLVLCLSNISDIFANNKLYHTYPVLIGLDDLPLLCAGPALYFYVLFITGNNTKFNWRYLIHIVPILVY